MLRSYAAVVHMGGGAGEQIARQGAVVPTVRGRQNLSALNTATLTPEEARELASKVPTLDQVEEFIQSQPNREHSHLSVSAHFLGRPIVNPDQSKDARRLYTRMMERILRARERIRRRDHSGEWKKTKRTIQRSPFYVWVPHGGPAAGEPNRAAN